MDSMLFQEARRQEVPDRKNGIVIAIDVSKGKMDFGAFTADRRSKIRQLPRNREGFEALKSHIQELHAAGYEVWVGFEPTGPYSTCLREWLLECPCRTVQVNPFNVKRTKGVRDNSPLKTDRKDPRVIADLILQGCYLSVETREPVYAELRAAVLNWKSLVQERTRLRNEFQGLLEVWFPELQEVFRDRVCKTVRGLIRKWPCARALGEASWLSVASVVRQSGNGRVSAATAEQIWRTARASIAPVTGQQERHRHMCRLLARLEQVEAEQQLLRKELEELLGRIPDAAYLLSVPRVGVITVSCLLGMCGDLKAYRSYQRLEKFVGLNIYEVSSGKHRGELHISKRGSALAREALCLAAVSQMRASGLYADYVGEQRDRKQKPGKIRVAVARKLLELLYALARQGTPFDERRFFAAKAGHGHVILQGRQLKAAA